MMPDGSTVEKGKLPTRKNRKRAKGVARGICTRCGKEFEFEAWRLEPGREKFRRKVCGLACVVRYHGTPEERFWPNVSKGAECWEWIGSKQNWGYGQFSQDGKRITAHRWSYIHFKGPIPRGKVVMHSCDNPGCVNPDHLSIGTIRDNSQDMLKKGRAYWQRTSVS